MKLLSHDLCDFGWIHELGFRVPYEERTAERRREEREKYHQNEGKRV